MYPHSSWDYQPEEEVRICCEQIRAAEKRKRLKKERRKRKIERIKEALVTFFSI